MKESSFEDSLAELKASVVKELDNFAESLLNEAESARDAENSGLNTPSMRNWLTKDFNIQECWCNTFVGTDGSGPWDIEEFDRFLGGFGFELGHIPNPDIEIIILGQYDLDYKAIREQLNITKSRNLIILSQELFVASLIKNENPISSFIDADFSEIYENHKGLTHAMNHGYQLRMQTLDDEVIEWDVNDSTFASESPLRAFGYSAGTSGPTDSQRRILLDRFYHAAQLPLVVTGADKARWGRPSSAQRLYSMYKFIGWLIWFKGVNAPSAKAKWESDLAWLRQKYYISSMQFNWPPIKSNSIKSRVSTGKSNRVAMPPAAWPFKTR